MVSNSITSPEDLHLTLLKSWRILIFCSCLPWFAGSADKWEWRSWPPLALSCAPKTCSYYCYDTPQCWRCSFCNAKPSQGMYERSRLVNGRVVFSLIIKILFDLHLIFGHLKVVISMRGMLSFKIIRPIYIAPWEGLQVHTSQFAAVYARNTRTNPFLFQISVLGSFTCSTQYTGPSASFPIRRLKH